MNDWNTYWNEYWNHSPQVRQTDVLRQVGKTVNGQPISAQQLDALVGDIRERLALGPGDALLDLCCGNGAITARLAPLCKRTTGVDFSAPLLAVARRQFMAPGTDYVLADVCALPAGLLQGGYNKVYMLEGLQHLSGEQADRLLGQFTGAARPTILFSAVPDAERIWNFYDTPARREEYERRRREGNEAIGHWWSRDELQALAQAHGYAAEFLMPSPDVHGAHYRIDLLLSPAAPGQESCQRGRTSP